MPVTSMCPESVAPYGSHLELSPVKIDFTGEGGRQHGWCRLNVCLVP